MNAELQALLRTATPNMPPEVAWPLVEQCEKIERVEDLPTDALATIKEYAR